MVTWWDAEQVQINWTSSEHFRSDQSWRTALGGTLHLDPCEVYLGTIAPLVSCIPLPLATAVARVTLRSKICFCRQTSMCTWSGMVVSRSIYHKQDAGQSQLQTSPLCRRFHPPSPQHPRAADTIEIQLMDVDIDHAWAFNRWCNHWDACFNPSFARKWCQGRKRVDWYEFWHPQAVKLRAFEKKPTWIQHHHGMPLYS